MRKRGLVFLGMVGAAAYFGYRQARSYLSPLNPEKARAYGRYLVARHRRVMVIGSDLVDIHRFAGGALRLMAESGSDVQIVVASGANAASPENRDLPAAVPLGLEPPQIRDMGRLTEEIRSLWRRMRPDTVLCPDPTQPIPLRSVPARSVGRAAHTLKQSMPEPVEMVFYATRLPNAVVDIGPLVEDKVQGVKPENGDGALKRIDMVIWSKLSSAKTGFSYAEAFRFLELGEAVLAQEESLREESRITD